MENNPLHKAFGFRQRWTASWWSSEQSLFIHSEREHTIFVYFEIIDRKKTDRNTNSKYITWEYSELFQYGMACCAILVGLVLECVDCILGGDFQIVDRFQRALVDGFECGLQLWIDLLAFLLQVVAEFLRWRDYGAEGAFSCLLSIRIGANRAHQMQSHQKAITKLLRKWPTPKRGHLLGSSWCRHWRGRGFCSSNRSWHLRLCWWTSGIALRLCLAMVWPSQSKQYENQHLIDGLHSIWSWKAPAVPLPTIWPHLCASCSQMRWNVVVPLTPALHRC